ncbi:hypothetical protein LCGC14_2120390, partial [marine sediment metagenome]
EENMKSAKVRELLDHGTLKWYDELPVIEYIDSEHVAYFLGGTTPRERLNREDNENIIFEYTAAYDLLRTWKHGLGKCPVVMITGEKTEIPEFEYRFKGFLNDAKDALLAYDFLLSRLATMVYAYYLPSYRWQIAATSAHFQGRERPEMEIKLGGVTVTYADEELSVLPYPTDLPDAGQLLSEVDSVIQRHTLEDVLFGRVQGSAPAFQVALRINVAKCADSNENLLLPDGTTKTYGELASSGEPFEIMTPEGIRTAMATFDEVEPLYEIKLESGKIITRSAHHKIWSSSGKISHTIVPEGKFNLVRDIIGDDRVAVMNTLKTKESEQYIDNDLAFIIGLLLGDGSFNKRGGIEFTCANRAIEKEFLDAANRLHEYPTSLPSREVRECKTWYVPKNKESLIHSVSDWLGLKRKNAFTKKLPNITHSWTKEIFNFWLVTLLSI